ncbi:unnamed protein product [Rotaria magnacalcarata]|uniref:Major facilitator superfamily (MFS) profile domain-containing protein n=4 Tax=Rotaria magnacalcarata TaxID=392030 RepID=A0A816KCR0_9BILA|nr:unnamed protein product [Rotaria magnacalcarata]CAF1916456.1 unnamed protein product [Rotaria magnacalcarata]
MISNDAEMKRMRQMEQTIDSTQRGCTSSLLMSCIILTLTTAFVFGWGLAAPNMYNHYTELFLKGENPCSIEYDVAIQSKQNLTVISSINVHSKLDVMINEDYAGNEKNIHPNFQLSPDTLRVNRDSNNNIETNMKKERLDFVNELIKGIPQTIFLVGAFIGALTGPFWLKVIDRKQAVYVNYIFTFTSSLCMLLSYYLNVSWLFYLSRFLLGYQGGMACVVVPSYIGEIASQRVRGRAGSAFRLSLTIGILIAQVTGMPFMAGNCYSWGWGLAIVSLLPFIGLFLLFLIPNSPTQMIAVYNNEEQAREDLRKLRGTENVQADIDIIHRQIQQRTSGSQSKVLSIPKVLISARYRWPMLTTMILQWSQALSGINAVFFYSSKMFLKAGISPTMIPYANIGTGLINVIATLIGLSLIERIGRRALVIYPMVVMVVVFGVLTFLIEYNEDRNSTRLGVIAVIFVFIFLVCFSIGLGPIPFFYANEVSRPEARDSIQALGFVVNYVGNIILSLFFPAFNSMLGGYVFLIFLFFLLISLGFLWLKMPETRNSTIGDLENFWKIPSNPPSDSLIVSSVKT